MGNEESNESEEMVTVEPWECENCREFTDRPVCPICYRIAPVSIEPIRYNPVLGTTGAGSLGKGNDAISTLTMIFFGLPVIVLILYQVIILVQRWLSN